MSATSFLGTVAHTLYQQYKERIDTCCFVFPGRRAALFFERELTNLATEEMWMPTTMGITQFVEKFTSQKASDPYVLLLELFKIYRNLTGKTESLEQFQYLGNVLLHDFDQVDKYLLNPKVLFNNVKDLQQVEQDFHFLTDEQKKALASFWSSFLKKPDHPLHKHFITLWEILPNLYSIFGSTLETKNLAYEGLLYRKMANEIEQTKQNAFIESYDTFVFVGFNALNPCEKKLFHFLKNTEKALFYWDYDPFYTENKIHEAGLFLRENTKDFPSALLPDEKHSLKQKKESIQIVSVPSRVMQAKVVPQILKEHNIPYEINTAVVLTDESLLLPLLYGLGNGMKKGEVVNVTMGFPLIGTSLFSLIQSALQYFFQSEEEKDITPLMMHPYIELLELEPLLRHIPKTAEELYKFLLEIINRTATSSKLPAEDALVKTVAKEMRRQINRLYLSISSSELDISATVFADFVKQQLAGSIIPFSGEPLWGLQVMGLLETRCLDFENLVLVSAQDHLLPKSHKEVSVIPYNLRRAFGLPTQEQHTAIWAYYFYRLLQRAKNIFFIYNNNPDSPSGGEVSRFVRQIELELPNLFVTSSPLVFHYHLPHIAPVIVSKTGSVQKKLQSFLSAESGRILSPTAILSYIRCPLQFYFKYLKSLNNPAFAPEEPDILHIGNTTHHLLERLYRPIVGKILEKEDILHRLSQTNTKGIFTKELDGNQILHEEIAAFYTKRFVRFDATQTPFKVVSLEESFFFKYENIPMTGIVDRVDIRQGKKVLIDYKTGERKNSFERVADLFSSKYTLKNGDAFQMLCYSYLIKDLSDNNELPVPMLFYLNNPVADVSGSYISYNREALDTSTALSSIKDEFIDHLDDLLKELFNFNIPFKQTNELKNCTFCPYISICQREKIND